MAVKFGIRNYSRSGDTVTFTVAALNADGAVDTTYAGAVSFGLNNISDPGSYTFVAGDQGQRVFTATITNSNLRAGLAALFPGESTGANLSVSGPGGSNTSFGLQGDHLLVGDIGNDIYNSNNGDDTFLLHQGGNDIATGGGGDDGVYFGGAFGVGDSANLGAGNRDQVAFRGNYAAATTLTASQFTGVEGFSILTAMDGTFEPVIGESFDYVFVLTGAWSGTTIFNWNGLNGAEDVTIDASGTTAGAFTFFGGFGVETLTGGDADDGFYFGAGRYNSLFDRVDGGGGTDNQIALRGNFEIGFLDTSFTNIQTIALISGSDSRYVPTAPTSYSLNMADGNVGAGQQLTVTGAGLGSMEVLFVNGAAEGDGSFRMIGGAAADTFIGGAGADIFWGGLGADTFTGNGGGDRYVYTALDQSLAAAADDILAMEAKDIIDVAAIDADAVEAGEQDFLFIGSQAFSGAGQLRIVNSGDNFRLEINTDADTATVEFAIDIITGGFTPGIDQLEGVFVI